MANIALIIAGGIGSRMGQEIPKQFLTVYEKPVIPTGGNPTLTANGHDPDDPYILKESVENGDGTNTLSLSVTGSRAPMEAEKVAVSLEILKEIPAEKRAGFLDAMKDRELYGEEQETI